jgi:hypothetical protein
MLSCQAPPVLAGGHEEPDRGSRRRAILAVGRAR